MCCFHAFHSLKSYMRAPVRLTPSIPIRGVRRGGASMMVLQNVICRCCLPFPRSNRKYFTPLGGARQREGITPFKGRYKRDTVGRLELGSSLPPRHCELSSCPSTPLPRLSQKQSLTTPSRTPKKSTNKTSVPPCSVPDG